MRIVVIAAMDNNRVIGYNNDIPWHIPEDLKHFKETTKNSPIIMGRNTWESLPVRPLKNRENIVVYSPEKGYVSGGEHYGARDILTAVYEIARDHLKAETVYIIGGAKIYESAIHIADELVITTVHGVHKGDTFFPPIDRAIWENYATKSLGIEEAFVTYYRRKHS